MIGMDLCLFIANVELPEGVKFYDFGEGLPIVPQISEGQYLITKLVRLVKGEKHVDIEITSLKGAIYAGSTISVLHFAQKLEDAIQELS